MAPTISSNEPEHGATAVITHRVRQGAQHSYESWLKEIALVCKTHPGLLDIQIVRPISGLTWAYTIIVRFDTLDHLLNWTESQDRRRLIQKARPLLAEDDNFLVQSGLDFWFTPQGADLKIPTRWKQFLVTWSAIYPLVLLVPSIVTPILRRLHFPDNHYLATLFITGTVVLLMVYVVMPRYTRLVHRWLFR